MSHPRIKLKSKSFLISEGNFLDTRPLAQVALIFEQALIKI